MLHYCRVPFAFFVPATLFIGTPILLAIGVSSIVAFLPVLVSPCVPMVMLTCGCLESGPNRFSATNVCIWVATMALFAALITFFVLFPLSLDGTIQNSTTGDYAVMLTPIWFLSFLITIVGFGAYLVKGWRGNYDLCHGGCRRNFGDRCFATFLTSSIVTTIGAFNFSLIALCYKASGEWDVMSYTALVGILGGSMAMLGVCVICGWLQGFNGI